MAEQFANHPGTTLATAISTTSRPVTVILASSASLPSSANFRLLIEQELLLVTAVLGANSYTASTVEGTTAATHASGVLVSHILTAGALVQLEADVTAGAVSTGLQVANNLSDVASVSLSRGNLGLGSAAVANASALTESTSAILTITGGSNALLSPASIQVKQASGSQPGYLTPADWSTFNGKQAALGFTPLTPANDLSDVSSASTARANLGLGTSATLTAGAANGVATLDSGGTLTAAQIPASITGAVVYQGVWNAATNTPTLASGVGSKGNYYKVSTAGTNAIDGIGSWGLGDTIIFDGTVWDKIDGQAIEVLTVFGRSGAITAQSGDYTSAQIGLGNVTNALQLAASSNLSDLISASAARTNLGLATVAASGSYTDLTSTPTLGTAAIHAAADFDAAGSASSAVAAIPNATSSVTGLLASTDWTTFNAKQSALGFTPAALTVNTFSGTQTFTVAPVFTDAAGTCTALGLSSAATATPASLTEVNSSVLTISGGSAALLAPASIQVKQASTSVSGYLGSTDWNTFNGKQAALGFTPLNAASNLSDLASASAARSNLGLGSSAVLAAGSASGVATLDSGGKLTSSQIPASLVGAVVFQGTWNAATNTPTLASGVGTKGFYYKTATAGTTTIDGIGSWSLGDSIIFDGTAWDKIDGQAVEVLTVFGRSGAVTATSGDYTATQVGLGNVSNALQLAAANNLSDLPSASTARTNLGLTSAATATPASLTESTSSVLTITGGSAALLAAATIQVQKATASVPGYLASADFTTFNGKQAALTITNDTNVTGSIAGSTLTLGWTGTLAAGRLNSSVVQSVVNDTNITGSITSQTLTLGFTGQLAITRGGTGASSASAALTALGGASLSANNTFAGIQTLGGNSFFAANGKLGLGIGTGQNYALAVNGGVVLSGLSTPGAPTVTPTGTTGSTTYSYTVVAVQFDNSSTNAGSAGSTTTGNATLSGSNYNSLSWSPVANAYGYNVYRTVGGATQGAISTFQTGTTLNDTGLTASGSAPASNSTGQLVLGNGTLILNGTTQTLSSGSKLTVTNPSNANDATVAVMSINGGAADPTLGTLGLFVSVNSSATGANRFITLSASDGVAFRPLVLGGYNGAFYSPILVGTKTWDGGSAFQVTGTATINGRLSINSSTTTIALSTPGAPTVTPTGTAGSTSYSYTVVALQADGSTTIAGTAGSTTTGNATLNGTNYNALSWTAVTNAASYSVYRTVSGGTPSSTGKIATAQTATTLNDTGLTVSGSSPTTNTTGSLTLGGKIASYNGVSTVANGVGAIVAQVDLTAQAANIGLTTFYAVPAGAAGIYRVTCYAVVTQAATTSSTLPQTNVWFTDADASVTGGGIASPNYSGNLLGCNSANIGTVVSAVTLNAKASTNIQYTTTGYATSGATPMQYALHIRLEYLG